MSRVTELGGTVPTARDPSRSALARALPRAAQLAGRGGLYLLLSGGLLYFTYKYYQPQLSGTDYFKYYNMYLHPLNLHAASSPFVYRQVSAVATNLVYRFAPYYDPQIYFAQPGLDQHVFFASLLTNYLALAACAVVTSVATERLSPGAAPSVAIFAGALCYLAFFAQECGMGPITDGMAWLLVAVGFLGYVGRSAITVAIVVALSVVERETIPVMIGAIAAADLVMARGRRRFDAVVIALCLAALAAYWAMRTIWIPIAGHENQTQIRWMFRRLAHWRSWFGKDVLFQDVLSQNLLILLAVVAAWRIWSPTGRSRAPSPETARLIVGLLAAAGALAAVCFLTLSPGNTNVGRIIAMLTPVTATLLALAMFQDERAPAPA